MMTDIVLGAVAFALTAALCVVCYFLSKPTVSDIGPEDKQVAIGAKRKSDPRGYFYVEIPMSFLNSKSWAESQITVLPIVGKKSYYDCDIYDYPYTPFLTACWNADYSSMKALLYSGADPSQKTDEGISGLALCAYRMAKKDAPWKPKCLKLLLKAGCTVDEATKEGNTALHFAVKAGSVDVVKWLIEHGADEHKINNSGWSPYHLAITKGNESIIDTFTSSSPVRSTNPTLSIENADLEE